MDDYHWHSLLSLLGHQLASNVISLFLLQIILLQFLEVSFLMLCSFVGTRLFFRKAVSFTFPLA